MAKALIIVESPTKIKTLKKFLGTNFHFESSVGHVRDLPQKGFGIDVEANFEPTYEILPDKKEVIEKLKKAAQQADIVYLAPDPDREGEAIAWHIASILPAKTKIKRVTFNSITKEAVQEALSHPRAIDQSLVDAQQARRLLDRIVGYKISPILMRRVQGARDGGLSAGRVQSVALKLVVDRERAIEAFIPVEYWNISATLQKESASFEARLYSLDGARVEKEADPQRNVISINNKKDADAVVARLKKADYRVETVEKKEKKRTSAAPFITSTIQQEASRHYGFSASRTMGIAQSLYEGVDLGSEGAEGLITYMRTDSVRVAPEAIQMVRAHIQKTYGKDYLPEAPNHFASKKSAQDAHEAIRPTNLKFSPEAIRRYLTEDQYKLYSLIYKRFVASQMTPAIYDTVSADISAGPGVILRATGSVIKFPGFLAAYEEKQDDHHLEEKENAEMILPPLVEKEKLALLKTNSLQSFTRPPPRFTEASLVKELEKSGVGRPSTYAAIMNKIQSRDYSTKEKGTLKPTELGKVICKMLEDNFDLIMDIGFTARLEDDLEYIAESGRSWKDLMHHFWDKFIPLVEKAEEHAFVPKELTELDCPKCGNKLQKIWSKRKYFYGCSTYPDCDYTMPVEAVDFNKADYDPTFDWDQLCPHCQSAMQLRFGKFGAFLGCSKYPDCKGIVNIPRKGELSSADMPPCPAIGCDGKITQRRSRFGKPFFSCSNYPDCDVIANHIEDLAEKYPHHPKTAYVKVAKKGAKKTAAKKTATKKKTAAKKTAKKAAPKQKAIALSNALQALVGAKELSRPEIVKKLWDYIKEHNCQNSKNKREIIPDAKMQKVFGKEKFDMMKLAGKLSDHLNS